MTDGPAMPALRDPQWLDAPFPDVPFDFWTSILRKRLLITSRDTSMKFLEATPFAFRGIKKIRKACGS